MAGDTYASKGIPTTNTGGKFLISEAEGQTATNAPVGYTDKVELTCAYCIDQGMQGAVYTHWGRSTCPASHALVYAGYAAGGKNTDAGTGSQSLCLTAMPRYGQFSTADQAGPRVFATEYQDSSPTIGTFLSVVNDHDARCSLCVTPGRAWSLMVPGRQACPSSFTLDYKGYLMSQHFGLSNWYRSEYVCVDLDTTASSAPATSVAEGTAANNAYSPSWYPV